jgi:hypothetical protein
MIKVRIAMAEIDMENISLKVVQNRGTSIAITLPPGWAEPGQKVCVMKKDENTLIVSKKLG